MTIGYSHEGGGDKYFPGFIQHVRISNIARTNFPYAKVDAKASVAVGTAIGPPVAGSAELAFNNLAIYPNPDGGLLIQAIIENQGERDTQNGFFTDLYVDHLPTGGGDYTGSLQFWVNDPIEAGTSVTLTTIITDWGTSSNLMLSSMTAGSELSGTLYGQVDSSGVISETNNNNNIYSTGIEICLASSDAYEDDETYSLASLISVDEVQVHNFDRLDDLDWVKFEAQGGITYTLQTSDLDLSADTYLYVYDTDGVTLLASNDDYEGSLASYIEWTAPTTGTYYVLIRHWNPNVGGCSTGYNFRLAEPGFEVFLPIIVRNNAQSSKIDQIGFAGDYDGDQEIYMMNTDGTSLTQLTHNSVKDEALSWSPDGNRIVFHSSRDDYNQIYVMNADGSDQSRLIVSSNIDEWPYWSPTGDKITFSRIANHNGDGSYYSEVFVMDADGSNISRLTFTTGETNGYSHKCWPSGWSPDGNQILFYCYIAGNNQIWIMNADGTNQQVLLSDSNWNAIPSMAPNGQDIAFASYRDGNYEIYKMNINNPVPIRLTNSSHEDWRPVWSTDGSKILFESERDGLKQIYWMNPDDSVQERLTDNTANVGQAVWRP